MHKERFLVQWTIEDTVEVLLPPTATERQITEAARKAISNELRKARGCAYEINIGNYEGPY
jgi:hypothetical protein